MNARLNEMMQSWHLQPGSDPGVQIAALLESLQAAGLLRASAAAVLLGEQYHLSGAEDTRRMAELLSVTAADRVVDIACYVGGPARQLAREYGCEVVGVDISEDCIAIAERLAEIWGQEASSCPTGGCGGVRFICASAEAVPLADGSFTVAWSQGSFPPDLRWMHEIHRLLVPGGRLAFTGTIRPDLRAQHAAPLHSPVGVPRRSSAADPGPVAREQTDEPALDPFGARLFYLEEMVARVATMGFRVTSAEDISDLDLARGWLPARKKLEDNEARYRDLMGEEWVHQAYRSLDADIAAWRERRMGEARIVAMKE